MDPIKIVGNSSVHPIHICTATAFAETYNPYLFCHHVAINTDVAHAALDGFRDEERPTAISCARVLAA